jgi:hypothetical protein
LQQHLQLAVASRRADAELVRAVCQTPGRSLNQGGEAAVVARLRAGASFDEAFVDVPAPRRRQRSGGGGALLAPGELFCELAICEDAKDAVELLRGTGGLDDWFEQSDGLGGLDEFECEVLEQAEREARGLTLDAYLTQLSRQADQLTAIRDPENGIELATIHGAKGRQWPHVIVVSCDDRTLPHIRSLDVSAEDLARGEGIEAERRLAYVAFTRAQEHLELYHDKQRPSRFLEEAGLLRLGPPSMPRPARRTPPVPQPPKTRRVRKSVYGDPVAAARRPAQLMPNAADEQLPAATTTTRAPAARVDDPTSLRARRTQAVALVTQRRMPRRTTIGRLATDLELTADELASVLGVLDRATARTKLRRLDPAQTDTLARAIYELA